MLTFSFQPRFVIHCYGLIKKAYIPCDEPKTYLRKVFQVIVTNNLKHFPQGILAPFDIEVQHPDDFLVQLFYLYPDVMVEIIERQAKDLQRPPKTTLELLSTL